MSTNDGGRAYPSGEQYTTTDVVGNTYSHSKAPFHAGMSLRDWLAGQALSGLVGNGQYPAGQIAESAYSFADAMLAAREREARR